MLRNHAMRMHVRALTDGTIAAPRTEDEAMYQLHVLTKLLKKAYKKLSKKERTLYSMNSDVIERNFSYDKKPTTSVKPNSSK